MMHGALHGLTFGQLWEPFVFFTALVFEASYLMVAIGPWKRKFPGSRKVPQIKIITFTLAIIIYYLAFGTPLDYLADHVSFAWHMVQHIVEVMVMTPLLILGSEDWMMRPVLTWQLSRRIFFFMTRPSVGFIFFNVVFLGFHWPPAYDLTLRNGTVHVGEHLLFFIAAIFFWWPIMGPLPERPPLKPPIRMFYLFFAMSFMMPLSVYLTIAGHPWYVAYYIHDPRLAALGLTPLADQQYGGLIMLVAVLIVYGLAFAVTYFKYNELEWD